MPNNNQTIKSAWGITEPNDLAYVREIVEYGESDLVPIDADFTYLRFGRKPPSELSEISNALQIRDLSQLQTHPLFRRVLFEVIASLETETQFDDLHKELKNRTIATYNLVQQYFKGDDLNMRAIESEMVEEISDEVELIKERYRNDQTLPTNQVTPEAKRFAELLAIVNRNIRANKYRPGQDDLYIRDAIDIVGEILKDEIYKKRSEQYVAETIEPYVQQAIDELGYERLTQHPTNERHTYMMAGAPACGKGTIQGMIEIEAQRKYGIRFRDIVKVDTDEHRMIVSDPKILGQDKRYHAAFNNIEAKVVSDIAYDKIKKKIASGHAPNFLIDGVKAHDQRLALATMDGAKCHLAIVTVPIEESVLRAYHRGVRSGRYVSAEYNIGAHKIISEELIRTLAKHKGQQIEFVLFDNSDAKGDGPPLPIMSGDLSKSEVTVHDRIKLQEFMDKRFANSKARSPAELFETPLTVDYDREMSHFARNNVSVTSEYTRRKSLHYSKDSERKSPVQYHAEKLTEHRHSPGQKQKHKQQQRKP